MCVAANFPWSFIPNCTRLVQNSVHGDHAELDPWWESPSFLFFFLVKKKEHGISITMHVGYVLGWIDALSLALRATRCAYTITTWLFAPVKRGGKKDDDYGMMLLIWIRFGADGQGDGDLSVGARLGTQWGAVGKGRSLCKARVWLTVYPYPALLDSFGAKI